MGNTKHRKDHKKKVLARKNRIKQEQNRMDKMKREFITNLIKREQEKGMFNENPTIQPVGPTTDSQMIEGPSI